MLIHRDLNHPHLICSLFYYLLLTDSKSTCVLRQVVPTMLFLTLCSQPQTFSSFLEYAFGGKSYRSFQDWIDFLILLTNRLRKNKQLVIIISTWLLKFSTFISPIYRFSLAVDAFAYTPSQSPKKHALIEEDTEQKNAEKCGKYTPLYPFCFSQAESFPSSDKKTGQW